MRTFWAQLGIWQSYYLREGSFLAPVIPIALRGLGTGKQAMAQVTTRDGVELFYEETGEGLPVVFVHEFAGDWRSWEPQVRYFSRRYRCINFNARGFPPSGVPDDPEMGFVDLGLDSLMAVELRQRLEARTGVSIPSTLAFDYPSIDEAADWLLETVLGEDIVLL